MLSVKMCIFQLQKHKNFKHGMLKENSKAWKNKELKALKVQQQDYIIYIR